MKFISLAAVVACGLWACSSPSNVTGSGTGNSPSTDPGAIPTPAGGTNGTYHNTDTTGSSGPVRVDSVAPK